MKHLEPAALEMVANFFAALAVPTRLRLMSELREGERNVGELTSATGLTQANVSKHLAVLASNGLVCREPQGTSVYYRIADERVFTLCDLVCGQIDERLRDLKTPQASLAAAVRRSSKR